MTGTCRSSGRIAGLVVTTARDLQAAQSVEDVLQRLVLPRKPAAAQAYQNPWFAAQLRCRLWRALPDRAGKASRSPGAAREHVRVANALRRMPTITALFREGQLSYFKVREVTRVVDVLDEQQLADFALTATAAQLATMIFGFRSADWRRIGRKTNGESAGANARTANQRRHVPLSGMSPNPASQSHHRVPSIAGGRTDLDNLILLCQWHHTAVHEGGVTITKAPDGWLFSKPRRATLPARGQR